MQLNLHPVKKQWNKLWNRKQFVFLSSSSLNIKQSKDLIEITLDSIVNLSIKKGWLFHSLVIESENHNVVLRGYRESDLLNFNHGVEKALLEIISNSDKSVFLYEGQIYNKPITRSEAQKALDNIYKCRYDSAIKKIANLMDFKI